MFWNYDGQSHSLFRTPGTPTRYAAIYEKPEKYELYIFESKTKIKSDNLEELKTVAQVLLSMKH